MRFGGPAAMLAALGLFAALDANSKLLSGAYPVAQVVLIRQVVILGLLGAARLLRDGAGGELGTRHPGLHLLRALAMLGSAFGFFQALREIPLAEGYLVYFTAPFMTLGLAALVLGERLPRTVWLWSGVGFLGVLVAMAPGLRAGGSLLAYGYALLGTVSYALVLTVNRGLRHEAGIARLVLWSALPGGLVLLPFAASDWVPPQGWDWLALGINGIFAGAATICLAVAFRHSSAARLAPLEFSALLWAVLADLLIWQALPTPATLAGGAIVVLACVMSQRAQRAVD
ncbi:DMT family transporter [Teichococcus vastitatis]|uniref:DMT family transporter n=1 Tax=Teichococcus vastitatis TaxID=2307076 RepID=A0ABS9VZL5_9PROT|nr:DMT family transporter [Pseudoroseomonas vastitatis]MCI0752466.1 DMT family transporter [Pseudoroseomonas vastitatis]